MGSQTSKIGEKEQIVMPTLQPAQYRERRFLQSVIFPPKTTIIPRRCFEKTLRLKSVTIPSTVRRIDFGAFSDSGITTVIFEEPSSLLEIQSCAFRNCKELEYITIPSSVRVIGKNSFQNCNKLKVTFGTKSVEQSPQSPSTQSPNPSSLAILGAMAFQQCGDLKDIMIPDNVQEIQVSCFYNSRLSSISFGKNSRLERVGSSAFEKCCFLSKQVVTLPKRVYLLENHAFAFSNVPGVQFTRDIVEDVDDVDDMCDMCDMCDMWDVDGVGDVDERDMDDIESHQDTYTHDIHPHDISTPLSPLSSLSSLPSSLILKHHCFHSITEENHDRMITIPSTLSYLGSHTFSFSHFHSITIHSDAILRRIPESCFKELQSKPLIHLPTSIRILQSFAFQDSCVVPNILQDNNEKIKPPSSRILPSILQEDNKMTKWSTSPTSPTSPPLSSSSSELLWIGKRCFSRFIRQAPLGGYRWTHLADTHQALHFFHQLSLIPEKISIRANRFRFFASTPNLIRTLAPKPLKLQLPSSVVGIEAYAFQGSRLLIDFSTSTSNSSDSTSTSTSKPNSDPDPVQVSGNLQYICRGAFEYNIIPKTITLSSPKYIDRRTLFCAAYGLQTLNIITENGDIQKVNFEHGVPKRSDSYNNNNNELSRNFNSSPSLYTSASDDEVEVEDSNEERRRSISIAPVETLMLIAR